MHSHCGNGYVNATLSTAAACRCAGARLCIYHATAGEEAAMRDWIAACGLVRSSCS